MIRAVFIGEGTSDTPLGGIVAALFERCGVQLDVSTPDFELLRRPLDVGSKISASLELTSAPIDLFIVHRDADTEDGSRRCEEIRSALEANAPSHRYLPVVPIHMTEAWLLLDEAAIRQVAGNPKGRVPLNLPSPREAERRADPKSVLAESILTASDETGRRRDRIARRFPENRRRLLEQLQIDGPVRQLGAWRELEARVNSVAQELSSAD